METTATRPLLNITEKAAAHVKEIARAEGKEVGGLRVAVKGGGCSGLSYKLSIEDKEQPGDKIIEQHGLKVYVDPKSLIYIYGTTLDFSDGLNGKGFTFVNPNAKSTCGCGNSFSA